MTELDPYYSNSKSVVQQQLDAAPEQQAAELSGLDARLAQANDNILAGARQRGLGFSGIPVAEQAKYAATDYAPAVANLKSKYIGQKNTLLEALNQLGRDQMGQAQGILDNEAARDLQMQQLAEQKRQFDLNLAEQKAQAARAAAAAGGSYSFGGNTAPTQKAQPEKTYIGNNDFRGHLAYLANKGNYEAKVLLKYVGNDGVFNGRVASQDELNILKRNGIRGNYTYGAGGGGGGGGW
ncbi:hypothetical protein [Mycobacteroides abscessus]|uniref:hypothetical protein n=1 Tax=Mycobacteroides abscessus TaxID=36809 RepID=UPI00092BA86F|nr:hypothetical protein [Mycobacteroides abscessus]SIC60176.1 Uncharacterised protein [Mycobacteroides abscessus subsp. abscessus]